VTFSLDAKSHQKDHACILSFPHAGFFTLVSGGFSGDLSKSLLSFPRTIPPLPALQKPERLMAGFYLIIDFPYVADCASKTGVTPEVRAALLHGD
jgi:hypothetical protein